jgi:hypothetical protein
MVVAKRRRRMPRGKGTYGSKVGRPPKKKKIGVGKSIKKSRRRMK